MYNLNTLLSIRRSRASRAGVVDGGDFSNHLAAGRGVPDLRRPRRRTGTEASIFVLDEPTEGLDAETARKVLDGVLQRLAGRTVLLLTHRPAGLERIDEIITLEAGKIVERQNFRPLLRDMP